jgi:hypothetical protein
LSTASAQEEFDRQLANLVAKGYPLLAGLEDEVFRKQVEPLRGRLPEGGDDGSRIPFVLVLAKGLVSPEAAVGVTELGGKRGFTTTEPGDLARFTPIDGVDIPAAAVYIVTDVDSGSQTLNVPPEDALPSILGAARSPVTLEEGVAVVTHFPEVLRERNCFSMLGSRCGDRRVTALWVSKGRPRLGWCWAGAPHSWLGSASCAGRS